MTARIPLVIGSQGFPQQLQAGDTILVPQSTSSVRSLLNGENSEAIVVGAPVYIYAAGTVKRAQANAMSTAKCIGLGYDSSIAAGASGLIAVGGTLVATTVQWDAVAGTTGGLVFGTTYWVDPANAGKITATPTTTVGQVLTQVGVASSTTELEISITQPVLL